MHIPLGARPFVGRLSAMLLNLGQAGRLLGNKEGILLPSRKKEKFTHETRPKTQKGSRIVFQAPFLFRGFWLLLLVFRELLTTPSVLWILLDLRPTFLAVWVGNMNRSTWAIPRITIPNR